MIYSKWKNHNVTDVAIMLLIVDDSMYMSLGYNERCNKETLIISTLKILPLDHQAW